MKVFFLITAIFFGFIGCNEQLGEVEFSCDCSNKTQPIEFQLIIKDFEKYNLEFTILSESKVNPIANKKSEEYINESSFKNYYTRTYKTKLLNSNDLLISIKDYIDIRISYAAKCEEVIIYPFLKNQKLSFNVSYRLKHFD